MLVLSRKRNERINIGPDISLVVVGVRGDTVRLGIEAPKALSIVRPDAKNQEKRRGK